MQKTWTPEELEQHLEAGKPASKFDRVWDGHTDQSVRSYLRLAAFELGRKRNISFAEAFRILCNEQQ
jgi:hypothetical protein